MIRSGFQLRAAQPLACKGRLSRCLTSRRQRLKVASQAPDGHVGADLDAHLDERSAASVAVLEQLYLAEAPPRLPADGSISDEDVQGQQAQQPQHRHHCHLEEVCGKMVCVEHAVNDSVASQGAEAAASGLIGRLLDMLPLSKRTRGIVMLNLLVLLVATNWVVVKDVGSSFDPFGFAFLRFAVAAAAFSPFMQAASKDKRILAAGIEIGVWTAAGYIAQSAGLLTTDASRASFLSTFTVLVVPFLAGLSGRGVSLVTWLSCAAALVGVGLLEQGGAPPGVGDVWSFLSAVAFGVQVFRTEHHARILGNGANLSLMSVVLTTTMAFSALAAGMAHPDALMDFIRHPVLAEHLLTADHFPWHQVLYCGLLTTDLALLMELLALQDVSSVEAAIIYTLEPVLGAAFAWGMLGERLGAKGMAGAAIIVASSLVTQVVGDGGQGDGKGDAKPAPASNDKDE